MDWRPESIRYVKENVGRTLHYTETKGIFKDEISLANQVEIKNK